MAIINKGTAFSNGEQLSAGKLNDLVDGATFGTDSVDNASTIVNANGAITVRDSGVTAAKLATGAVTTNTILDANVTTAKIADANVTFAKLTDVIDDDTMATATDTTLATSESIKAYVDEYAMKYSGSTGTISATTSFADWDLSSVVGANRAMVILELWDASVASSIMLKTKGSVLTPRPTNSNAGYGASGLVVDTNNEGGTAVLITDASGVIEIVSTGAVSGINYKIQAYQKLA